MSTEDLECLAMPSRGGGRGCSALGRAESCATPPGSTSEGRTGRLEARALRADAEACLCRLPLAPVPWVWNWGEAGSRELFS